MWNEGMDTSLQLSLRKVSPFSPVSSCFREICACPEQLHPLSWWEALTCVSTSTATTPVIFPFHFSRDVQQPSYILFLSSKHQWLLKAEILFVWFFLTILHVPYLQICSLSRLKIQGNKLFPSQICPVLRPWSLLRLVVLTLNLREYFSVSLKFLCFGKWVRSVVMTLSSDEEKAGSWKQDFLEALIRSTFLFSGKRIDLCC